MSNDSRRFEFFLCLRLGYYMGKGLFENYPDNFNKLIDEFAKELYEKAVEIAREEEKK